MRPLNELLQYQNPAVIRRFHIDFPQHQDRGEKLWPELLKYLWLTQQHENDRKRDPNKDATNFSCVMHVEMREIDDLWHCFILFTKDYAAFCEKYFDHFIHHIPDMREKNPQTEEEFAIDFTKYLNYVYDYLGEDTIRKWFAAHLEQADIIEKDLNSSSLTI